MERIYKQRFYRINLYILIEIRGTFRSVMDLSYYFIVFVKYDVIILLCLKNKQIEMF